jgi:glycosyltransferase involved in cell wall biosynthesis
MAAHHLRRAGVPYVLAPNGTAPLLERKVRIKHAYDVLIGQRIMAAASRVIAVSETERRQLESIGVNRDAIRVVPNPLDLDEFSAPIDGARFRHDHGLPAGPLILFLGKLTPRKRLDVLVHAAAKLQGSDWQLVIAGNDMGAGSGTRALVRTLGLEGRTHFTGLLSRHRRLEALAAADVVVYPSEDEIFGLVPLEALLCGTPVIVADDSGCGEVIAATGGGQVVRVGDAEALAAAIRQVLRSPDRWRAAAAGAAVNVRAAYNPQTVCDQIEDVYFSALRTRPSYESMRESVSFVVPVHNGAASIGECIDSIFAQADGRPMEVLVVDDRSQDGSSELLRSLAEKYSLRLLEGPGRGAAAAINIGVLAARYPIICQVDQDVILEANWMRLVVDELADRHVAAAQGYYVGDPRATVAAKVMARDLEQRYQAIQGSDTTHVCTGNSAYRAEALREVGLFDESLGYGYDNDMSYRLREAGYRLTLCRRARSIHRWREGVIGYLRQQYGFGYGRADLVSKHPRRLTGDSVSPLGMMAHPIVMTLALALAVVGVAWRPAATMGAVLLGLLALERLWAGVRGAVRFRDLTPLWFPVMHLARDLAWVVAMAVWSVRRIAGRRSRPSHSMRARPAERAPGIANLEVQGRVLGLIPAHNEAATLRAVVTDVRAHHPDLELLVIDDGSTDGTELVLERLGVRWLRFPECMGIGSGMRAGLRYAMRNGFDCAIRIDGDGQHGAEDIKRLLAPILAGHADVALGSRYVDLWPPKAAVSRRWTLVRMVQRTLGACMSVLVGGRVTDPTSGFCAFGPRAMRMLAEHHPTGYPEPELRLFLSRNSLDVVEVPVMARPRLGGTSSLTAWRMTTAGARVLLAMLMVPLRSTIGGARRD